MNIENELKLIPGKGITREQVVVVLRKFGFDVPEKGKVIHQEDTYFDDKEGTLEKSGGSFRIRRKNDKVQVTYKIPVESDTQYKQRKEYEIVVPKQYEQNLDMELAKKLLSEQYPELTFPENMGEILTVINNRNKTNITCADGTVLEMAFDNLQGKDGQGNIYDIRPEIEFETITGNPENLTQVYESVLKEFPGQTKRNSLSKYARAKQEISEKRLTVEEIAACAILSQILNSEEYNKLEYKGQVLHKHDKPVLTNLNNFKDFKYLVETIRKIKGGEYKVAIPRTVAEKEGMAALLEGENYEVKDSINLEEMMGVLLSDVKYMVASESLVDFFNTNFYGKDNAITNRKNHSQQVMLLSGLIAKSSYVGATFEDRLSCMITGLAHDIGHVPMAHNLEAVLKDMDGIFSHEVNGKITLDNIYERTEEQMKADVQKCLPEVSSEKIENVLVSKSTEIKSGIINHSRKGAEHREQGIVQQAARLADKIAYVFSDTRDFEQQREISIVDDNWTESAVLEICNGNEELAEEVNKRIVNDYTQYIKEGDYGRAAINAINTVHSHGDIGIYEVDRDVWAFVEQLISRVKEVRIESGVEKDKKAMTDAAKILIDKWLCEEYQNTDGDIDLAWKKLLGRITNTGELDMLEHLDGIRRLQGQIGESENGIQPRVDMKTGKLIKLEETDKDEILAYMSEKLFSASRMKGKKEGFNNKEEIEEYSQKEAGKIISDLDGLTVQELLNFDRYFTPSISEGVLARRLEEKVRGLADVQLKVNSEQRGCLDIIWRTLGITGDGRATRKEITDEYYAGKLNGVLNPKVKIRVRPDGNTKTLTVKVPVEKKVSERIERSYVFTQDSKGPELTVEEMLQKLKEQHPGLNIELAGKEPIEVLEITRMEYPRMYKGYEVMFVEDVFNGRDGKEYKEIEMKCPEHPPIITKIKNTLKGQVVFVKDSKIARVTSFQKGRD